MCILDMLLRVDCSRNLVELVAIFKLWLIILQPVVQFCQVNGESMLGL